ncbi:substrate-binding domain-containing protein [Microbacterium terrisoli]|uniref:substrate-binding domain-containing protein n=1 Tax=Microbacterium terrisoli TaxID=3242192 RepID=UPI0028039DE8|nr:substrate-binding domain-containing protein [Microbacterium protaetiae]
MKRSNIIAIAAGIVLAAASLAGCSSGGDSGGGAQPGSTVAGAPSWCGPKKIKLAQLDGFGGNSWRLVTTASGEQEVKKCPSVTSYEYANGQGDTQKSISDINAFASKGVDAMVVFADAGPAMLPTIRKAYQAGITMVPYRVEVGGTAGTDYTQFVGASFVNDGENWGKWIKKQFPSGAKMLFLSGPKGNSQGTDELKGLKNVLDDSYTFLNEAPYDVTNWDPALTQQVLTSEIAKNPQIDVIISDFGPSLVGALPVFQQSGRSIPAIATSDGNALGCFWKNNEKANPDFKLFTVATGNDNVRLAVQWAVAKATGGIPPTDTVFKAPVFEDSVSGTPHPVECQADLPGDIYLSAQLSPQDQAKAINNK